jgi:hypothetical protein
MTFLSGIRRIALDQESPNDLRRYFRPMIRRQRLVASFLAAFAIVFAQLAVAAHWCEMTSPAANAKLTQVMAHHDCCPDSSAPAGDPAGNVCQAHCQYGTTSVDNGSVVPPAVDAVGPALFLPVAVSEPDSSLRRAGRFAPAAAPRPPALLFGVLRI